MKLKGYLFISATFLFLVFITGCSDATTIDVTDKSKVVLIPDGDGGEALTISTFIKNNSDQISEPFYVEFEILNSKLQSKLEESKLIVGENFSGDTPGDIYKVKPQTTLQAGSTVRMNGNVEETSLKKIITKNNAVKVNLLSKDNDVIKSSYIKKFGKDLTADGKDDTK